MLGPRREGVDGIRDFILDHLREFADAHFTDYFQIVFGSHAYGLAKRNSDIDLITFTEHFDEGQVERIVSLFLDLSTRFSLSTSVEMPHRRILLVSYNDLSRAIDCKGFVKRGHTIEIPNIVRTKEFFMSDSMRLRLIFNAITTKNLFVAGNVERYLDMRKSAIINLIRLLFIVTDRDSMTLAELTQAAVSEQGSQRAAGNYLGFKDLTEVRAYLSSEFRVDLDELATLGYVVKEDARYSVLDKQWLASLGRL